MRSFEIDSKKVISAYIIFLELDIVIHFHCINKSNQGILLHISFCVTHRKEPGHTGLKQH